jgi:hypothetical protein
MENDMSTNEKNTNPSVVTSLPRTAPAPAPEVVVDQLRAVQIGEVTPLTAAERRKLRRRNITSNPVLQASINVIGAHDLIEQAVGQPADDVRRMYDDANRWTAVEDELRTMLNGVSSANLIRRQRISLIAGRAYGIALQLARDPANAILVPHVQEIRRLKSFSRRKKAARASDAPTSPALDTPEPRDPGTSKT